MGRLRKISSYDDVIFVLTKTAWHLCETVSVPENDEEWIVSWTSVKFCCVNRLWTCLQVKCSRPHVMWLYTFIVPAANPSTISTASSL